MRVRPLLAALLVLAIPLSLLGFVSGGAPAVEREGGGHEERPRVERWTVVSAARDDSGGWMCDEAHPCDLARQRLHAEDPCVWTARVWLASAPAIALREVHLKVFALATREGGAGVMTTFDPPWENGWWWRAEGERVDVALPIPCDAAQLTLTLNVQGRTLRGGVDQLAQTADIELR